MTEQARTIFDHEIAGRVLDEAGIENAAAADLLQHFLKGVSGEARLRLNRRADRDRNESGGQKRSDERARAGCVQVLNFLTREDFAEDECGARLFQKESARNALERRGVFGFERSRKRTLLLPLGFEHKGVGEKFELERKVPGGEMALPETADDEQNFHTERPKLCNLRRQIGKILVGPAVVEIGNVRSGLIRRVIRGGAPRSRKIPRGF